jgi:hypothetical protein
MLQDNFKCSTKATCCKGKVTIKCLQIGPLDFGTLESLIQRQILVV